MKKILFALLVVISAGNAQAEVELKDGSILMKYLSEVERTQFFAEQLDKFAEQLDKFAEQLDRNWDTRATDESDTTVTIEIHGAPIDESGFPSEAEAQAQTDQVVGYINCSISQHYPHATYYDGERVVKAKSSGSCDYTHESGPQPPTINWELLQILTGPRDAGKPHPRSGLHPRWSDSSAFIVT